MDEPVAPREGGGLVRVRLDLAYDGTDFVGWAMQPGQRSVEEELTKALVSVMRLPADTRVTVAGRTDSGVHARGQVVHVDVPLGAWQAVPGRSTRAPEVALPTRLAGVLPHDVVVRAAGRAPEGFDARFSASSRTYRYRISDRTATRDPMRRRDVTWLPPRELDVESMGASTLALLGEHDWLPYCRPRDGATTIRTLLEYRWWRDDAGVVVGQVTADAFCHHMVRALVGACVAVGGGRQPVDWPSQVLRAGVRNHRVMVMPAQGLTLESVSYPADGELAEQARRARRVRTLTTSSTQNCD